MCLPVFYLRHLRFAQVHEWRETSGARTRQASAKTKAQHMHCARASTEPPDLPECSQTPRGTSIAPTVRQPLGQETAFPSNSLQDYKMRAQKVGATEPGPGPQEKSTTLNTGLWDAGSQVLAPSKRWPNGWEATRADPQAHKTYQRAGKETALFLKTCNRSLEVCQLQTSQPLGLCRLEPRGANLKGRDKPLALCSP